MQWSRAFSLMCDTALRLMCGGIPTAPNQASLLTSRCERLGWAAGSSGRLQTTARPPTDRQTDRWTDRPTDGRTDLAKLRQEGRSAARVGSAHDFCAVSTFVVDETLYLECDASMGVLDTGTVVVLSDLCVQYLKNEEMETLVNVAHLQSSKILGHG